MNLRNVKLILSLRRSRIGRTRRRKTRKNEKQTEREAEEEEELEEATLVVYKGNLIQENVMAIVGERSGSKTEGKGEGSEVEVDES